MLIGILLLVGLSMCLYGAWKVFLFLTQDDESYIISKKTLVCMGVGLLVLLLAALLSTIL